MLTPILSYCCALALGLRSWWSSFDFLGLWLYLLSSLSCNYQRVDGRNETITNSKCVPLVFNNGPTKRFSGGEEPQKGKPWWSWSAHGLVFPHRLVLAHNQLLKMAFDGWRWWGIAGAFPSKVGVAMPAAGQWSDLPIPTPKTLITKEKICIRVCVCTHTCIYTHMRIIHMHTHLFLCVCVCVLKSISFIKRAKPKSLPTAFVHWWEGQSPKETIKPVGCLSWWRGIWQAKCKIETASAHKPGPQRAFSVPGQASLLTSPPHVFTWASSFRPSESGWIHTYLPRRLQQNISDCTCFPFDPRLFLGVILTLRKGK